MKPTLPFDNKEKKFSGVIPKSKFNVFKEIDDPILKYTICTKCKENPASKDSDLCDWCK